MQIRVIYNESGGKLIPVRTGDAVPVVRASDGVLLLVTYGPDLHDGHYDGRGSVIDNERVLAELPGVTFLRFVRTDLVRVQVPCHDLGGLRKTLQQHKLQLATTHVDEVNGGASWSGVRECLARHNWGPDDHERWGVGRPLSETVKRGRLYRHGLTDATGLTAEEVCDWIRRIMAANYHADLEQVQTALDGLVRVGAATVCDVDDRRHYRMAR